MCQFSFLHPSTGIDESQPHLEDLMNQVAAQIPSKWRLVGIQLGLGDLMLNLIETNYRGTPTECLSSFMQVLSLWKHRKTKPYTWETMINALQAESVGEECLAKMLAEKHCKF